MSTAQTPAPPSPTTGHYIVCGLNSLGLRVIENLAARGESIVVVAERAHPSYRAAVEALGIHIVDGDPNEEVTLDAAGIGDAKGIAFVVDSDRANLQAAIKAGTKNPEARIVLRLYNEDLGERIRSLFTDCTILSQSAIVAPFFAAAALGETEGERFALGNHAFLVRRTDAGDATKLGTAIPLVNFSDGTAELFPSAAAAGGEVLEDLGAFDDATGFDRVPRITPKPRGLKERWSSAIGLLRQLVDRRIRLTLTVMAALLACATAYFSVTKGLSPVDALYFSVVTLSTVGYGDINLQNDPPHVKVVGILYILVGAAVTATLFALITDTLVGVRLARALGGVRRRMDGHIIICGLGNVGTRIAKLLAEKGVSVVAVERDEASRHVAAVRQMGIPVVIGDASNTEIQEQAQVASAAAMIVATSNDLIDLETAILARTLHPHLRIVLRLFDHDLSTALEKRFGIHISRSSALIAAPVFVAALLAESDVVSVNIHGTSLLFAELATSGSAELTGVTIASLQQKGDLRILAVSPAQDQSWQWYPEASRAIERGERLAVVGRPDAVAGVRARVETSR